MYRIQQLVNILLQMVVSIYEVLQSVKSFEELEERVQRITQRMTAELIQIAVEEIDERLGNERDKKQLTNIGKRKRTLVTTAGEIS
ncbi:MAG: ISLre2 family transposase, partial [Syntrophomonadaceae bacterium]|nr:ISLre2 family transposase [Syntrophomonadaceae bacterium]